MKYCVECGSEFQVEREFCSDCPGSHLVDAQTMNRLGLPLPGEEDSRRFIRAATAEDPLTAEEMVRTLEEARIPVLARPRRSGSVDLLTTGITHPWWEIMVTEQHASRAQELLTRSAAQGERTTGSEEGWRGL